MSDENKRNLVYFESPSMRGLYDCLEAWQQAHQKRFLSVSVHQDAGNFCCIALTNPTEVLLVDKDGDYAHLDRGSVCVVMDAQF